MYVRLCEQDYVESREEVFLFLCLTEHQSDNSLTDEPPTHGNVFSLIQC